MKLKIKLKIKREIEVSVSAKTWENADDAQRLLFAKKQVEEEMFVKLRDYEEATISYTPENKEFPKYIEKIDKNGIKSYTNEKQ